MKNEELKRFKLAFERERDSLLKANRFSDPLIHVRPEELKDETDWTSHAMEQAMHLRMRNREALYLKKVEQALQRIQEGTFGECEDCEEEIGLRRLEVRPTATLCISCKEAREKAESGYADGHLHKSLGETVHFGVA